MKHRFPSFILTLFITLAPGAASAAIEFTPPTGHTPSKAPSSERDGSDNWLSVFNGKEPTGRYSFFSKTW